MNPDEGSLRLAFMSHGEETAMLVLRPGQGPTRGPDSWKPGHLQLQGRPPHSFAGSPTPLPVGGRVECVSLGLIHTAACLRGVGAPSLPGRDSRAEPALGDTGGRWDFLRALRLIDSDPFVPEAVRSWIRLKRGALHRQVQAAGNRYQGCGRLWSLCLVPLGVCPASLQEHGWGLCPLRGWRGPQTAHLPQAAVGRVLRCRHLLLRLPAEAWGCSPASGCPREGPGSA